MTDLPPGWEWARFDDVAAVDGRLVEPLDFPTHPHIAPNHIQSGTGRLLEYATVAEDGVTSKKYFFRPGQILYSKIRPYLAKAVLIGFEGLCSADMYPVSASIDSRYLWYWLISPQFTAAAAGKQGRSVLPKINRADLVKLAVPVAPLAEQRRIVSAIEEQFTRIEAVSTSVQKAARLLGLEVTGMGGGPLRASILVQAFSGELVPQDSEDESAQDLLDRIAEERGVRPVGVKQGRRQAKVAT